MLETIAAWQFPCKQYYIWKPGKNIEWYSYGIILFCQNLNAQVHQVLVSTFLIQLLRHLPILRRLLDDCLVMHILYSQENIKICLPRGHKNEIQRWTKSHFSKFEVGMMHISQIRGTYVCCCFLKKIAVASSEINLNNYLVLQHE